MNPKERVMARLEGRETDRIPNFSILMSFAARYAGYRMDEFCSDYRVLVDANIKSNMDFGIDLMNTMSDAYRETADFGAKITVRHDNLPHCEPFITSPGDMNKLRPFEIHDSTRMLDRLRAIELYKTKLGDEWPVMGWVEGCAAESADLMGLTELVFAMYDEPEMVREMMDICLETAINCIGPQVKAGADIIGVGDAVASVLGPDIYREWILPREKAIFDEIRRQGAIGRLHICGDLTPLLGDLRDTGADIIDIDWMVDFKTAHDKLSDKAFICGNFDPVSVVKDGNPQSVREAVDNCRRIGGNRCIIMAGCEIPRDTPHENLKAVADALAAD